MVTFDHTILIVDDELQIGKLIAATVKGVPAHSVYATNGKEALYKVEKRKTPFSLVISDQRMPEMEGVKLLEHIADLSPHTVRFLTTGYSDINAVIGAVNKGKIHKYIAKPWQPEQLLEDFKSGLKQFELIVENEMLFRTAKKQNAKLFSFNKALKQTTERQARELAEIDETLKAAIKESRSCQMMPDDDALSSVNMIRQHLADRNITCSDDVDQLNGLLEAVVIRLFSQFQEIASRKGIELDIQRVP